MRPERRVVTCDEFFGAATGTAVVYASNFVRRDRLVDVVGDAGYAAQSRECCGEDEASCLANREHLKSGDDRAVHHHRVASRRSGHDPFDEVTKIMAMRCQTTSSTPFPKHRIPNHMRPGFRSYVSPRPPPNFLGCGSRARVAPPRRGKTPRRGSEVGAPAEQMPVDLARARTRAAWGVGDSSPVARRPCPAFAALGR